MAWRAGLDPGLQGRITARSQAPSVASSRATARSLTPSMRAKLESVLQQENSKPRRARPRMRSRLRESASEQMLSAKRLEEHRRRYGAEGVHCVLLEVESKSDATALEERAIRQLQRRGLARLLNVAGQGARRSR